MAGLKRGRRSGGGECAKCSRQYDDLLEHIRKKHKGARFTEDEVDGTGLLACACGAVSSNARGLSHHQKRTMCVGLEETRRTSAVVPSTSPQPVPDSDAISDIVIFSSSHHSWVTHVSDTQPSRVLDTPHEESQDMAMLDWDADYEMSGDEEEGFDLPNQRSTTADTSQREVSHPRTLRSTTARLARSSVTHTPPTSSLPRPSPTYVSVPPQSTPPPPSIPPPDSPFDRFLSLGDLPTVHKPLSGPSAGVFAGCVERLAEAFLAEPSDDTLFNILALPKAGLAPGLKQGLKAQAGAVSPSRLAEARAE